MRRKALVTITTGDLIVSHQYLTLIPCEEIHDTIQRGYAFQTKILVDTLFSMEV